MTCLNLDNDPKKKEKHLPNKEAKCKILLAWTSFSHDQPSTPMVVTTNTVLHYCFVGSIILRLSAPLHVTKDVSSILSSSGGKWRMQRNLKLQTSTYLILILVEPHKQLETLLQITRSFISYFVYLSSTVLVQIFRYT